MAVVLLHDSRSTIASSSIVVRGVVVVYAVGTTR